MKRFTLLMTSLVLSSTVATAQSQIRCEDDSRAGMRQGSVSSTNDTVTFNLAGIELWGGVDESSPINLVTADGNDVTILSNEPGAHFSVSFPKSNCLFDGKSVFCRGSQMPNFSYWPFNNPSNKEVNLQVKSYDTTAVLGSGRMSLVMIMNRPQGGKSIQNISFFCN